MKRLAQALIVLNLFVFCVQPVAAASSGATHFLVGLWKAIDTQDGSEILLSISDVDGELRILLTDTFFSLCNNVDNLSPQGLAEGTGTLHNKTLVWEYTLKCYDPASNRLVVVDEDTTSFTVIRKDGILVGSSFGNVYHRIGSH